MTPAKIETVIYRQSTPVYSSWRGNIRGIRYKSFSVFFARQSKTGRTFRRTNSSTNEAAEEGTWVREYGRSDNWYRFDHGRTKIWKPDWPDTEGKEWNPFLHSIGKQSRPVTSQIYFIYWGCSSKENRLVPRPLAYYELASSGPMRNCATV